MTLRIFPGWRGCCESLCSMHHSEWKGDATAMVERCFSQMRNRYPIVYGFPILRLLAPSHTRRKQDGMRFRLQRAAPFFSLPSRRYYTEIRLCARAISFLRSDPSLFFSLSIAPFLFCPLASFFFIPPSFMYVRFALLLGIDIHIICIRRESGSSSFSIPRAAQKSPKLSCRISFRVFCP